jgi:hypothetical protein
LVAARESHTNAAGHGSLGHTNKPAVTISYRGAAFARARAKNRDRVNALIESEEIEALMRSGVRRIGRDVVEIDVGQNLRIIPNDDVIVCAGGLLPTQFLKDMGVAVETKYGTV